MIFEDTYKLIEEQNIIAVKIIDTSGRRIYDIVEDSPTKVIEKLKDYRHILSTYGKVIFKAATESIHKQNWKDCYQWSVVFTGSGNDAPAINSINMGVPNGYISGDHAILMAELNAIKAKFDLEKQILELKNQMAMSNQPQGIDKYLPMMGMFMDVDESKMKNMMMLANMQSMMSGKAPAQLAGMERTGNKVELKGTEEEQKLMQSITDEMDKLSDKTQLNNIDMLLKTLNNNPHLIDTLIQMATKFQTT